MKVNSKDWTLEISDSDRDKTMSGHVGANIRRFRKQAGLTQAELAKMLEHPDKRLTISRTALAGYEQGQAFPPYEKLERIASALKVSPTDILISEGAEKALADIGIQQRIRDDLFMLMGYSIERDNLAVLNTMVLLDDDSGEGIDPNVMNNALAKLPYRIIGNGKEAYASEQEFIDLMKQILDYSEFLIERFVEEKIKAE